MAEKPKPAPRGPDPDRLKIEGDWKDAAKKAIRKATPSEGWPKREDWREDRDKKRGPKD